ncbi:hypothetical protein MKY51_15715 [Solibacillus sp. FSL R5-0691]|uniref:hypothetical protein n=1 Tax=Solibacillus sp. FSL R5-0691 TaxID=2921653 RepID=UPI0030D50A13
MRRKIHLQIDSENNTVTEKWMQLLIQRIIVEQLDVPYRLKAKLLHQVLLAEKSKEDYSD